MKSFLWVVVMLACIGGSPWVMLGLFSGYVVYELLRQER